jgi:hypothetical protein
MTATPTPPAPSSPTFSAKLLSLVGVVISCAYLANLGAGVFPELPDNIPAVGNLDEVFFSGLLIVSLHKLGIQAIPGLAAPRKQAP